MAAAFLHFFGGVFTQEVQLSKKKHEIIQKLRVQNGLTVAEVERRVVDMPEPGHNQSLAPSAYLVGAARASDEFDAHEPRNKESNC